MKVFIATGNKHKVHEMSLMLSAFGIELEQKDISIIEPDFDSIEEIAVEKAKQAFEKIKKPVIAEDTGVYFEEYNNFPGQLAKRIYLGIGFEGLISLIKLKENKKAYFKTAVAYFDGEKSKVFSGKMEGTLLEEIVSLKKDRLPYEKLFVPNGFDKALVDLSVEEKNKISHRAKATKKFGEWFSNRQK